MPTPVDSVQPYRGRSQMEIHRLLEQATVLDVTSEEWHMLVNASAPMERFRLRASLQEKPAGADEALLRDALAAVTGERRKAYGDPENNFKLIAELFGSYLGHRRIHGGLADGVSGQLSLNDNIKPGDVAVLMVLVKVARLAQTPGHRDSLLDIAGYAACGARC